MNKIYKFSLAIIILIFIFLELSEFRRISYSRDTVYFSNLNNTVLLEKSLNSNTKKYLTDELADIHKIEEVSIKVKKTEPDSESQELESRTQPSSAKTSIFTQAFQAMTTRGIYSPSRGYTFNFQDCGIF